MQKFYFSSLFIYANLLAILFLPKKGIGQENTDSTTYYYTRILNPSPQEETQKSIAFFKRQLDIYQGEEHLFYRASILELIALGEFNQGELFKSETSAIESYKVLERTAQTPKTTAIRLRLANHLGRIYRRLGNHSKALNYYTETIALVPLKKDSLILSNNIASIYMDEHHYKKATELLEPFIKDIKQIEEDKEVSTVLNNYGYSLLQLENPEGISFIKKSLEINKKIKYRQGLFSTHRHIAEYYNNIGDSDTAREYITKAKEIAAQLKDPTFQLEAMGGAIEIGDTEDALAYKRLSEDLKRERQQTENKYIAQKYDYAQMQAQARENERIAQKEVTKSNWYKVVLASIILLTILIFTIIRAYNKKRRAEQVLNTEARLSKKVHDEVSNDVYRVMTQIQSKKGMYPDVLDSLENIYKRTRDISRENSAIDVDTNFRLTLGDLFMGYRIDTLTIITKNSEGLQWKLLSKGKKVTIYRVLQELLTNTSKYGKASVVVIEFSQKRREMHIVYTDNGAGGELSNKNGLQNVETRITAHKGSITFESEKTKGFKAHIQI